MLQIQQAIPQGYPPPRFCAQGVTNGLLVGCGVGFFEIGDLGGPRIPAPAIARPLLGPNRDARFAALTPLESFVAVYDAYDAPRCPQTRPRRRQDPPRAAQERPRAPEDAPGPLKWSQVGAKIELRWVLMLKTVTSPKLLKKQCDLKGLSSCGAPKPSHFLCFFVRNAGSCCKTHQDAAPGTLQRPFKTPQDVYWIRFWGNLGFTWSILGP